ncbi:MAG TPA: hypothetical protein VF789_14890, partial [Thermoanaerobaculia bacterium]
CASRSSSALSSAERTIGTATLIFPPGSIPYQMRVTDVPEYRTHYTSFTDGAVRTSVGKSLIEIWQDLMNDIVERPWTYRADLHLLNVDYIGSFKLQIAAVSWLDHQLRPLRLVRFFKLQVKNAICLKERPKELIVDATKVFGTPCSLCLCHM